MTTCKELACGLLAAAAIMIGAASSAMACRCTDPDLPAAYRGAESIVLATVRSVEQRSEFDASYTLAVAQSWKRGLGQSPTIRSRGTCIYRAEPGVTYLLYLRPYAGGGYQTSRCMGNVREPDAAKALHWLRSRTR